MLRGNHADRLAQAVYHSESQTRRRAFEQKRQEKEEAEHTRIRTEKALLDACDAVWYAEQVLKHEGPETQNDGFSQRYVIAANEIDRLKEYRDRLYDEVYAWNGL